MRRTKGMEKPLGGGGTEKRSIHVHGNYKGWCTTRCRLRVLFDWHSVGDWEREREGGVTCM